MSGFSKLLALITSGSILGATIAMATADGPDYFSVIGVDVNDVLNVRTAPDASGALVGKIPHDGDGIANLGCVGGLTFAQWDKATDAECDAGAKTRWCRVGYDRTIGWAAGWYLTEGSYDDQFRAGGILGKISGSEWRLQDLAGDVPPAEAWIAFKSSDAVVGNGGCNSFKGTLLSQTGAPIFSPMASTRKFCPNAEMETEARLFEVLGSAHEMISYHLVMALFDENGSLLATFSRRDAD